MIEIMVQHADPDERDCLLIHEICHAVADGGHGGTDQENSTGFDPFKRSVPHGKVWQRRLEKAAVRADELGRDVLAKLLRQQIADYQEAAKPHREAYQTAEDWLNHNPDLTLAQVKKSLADQYGLLASEVCTTFRRFEKVCRAAKKEALEARAIKAKWLDRSKR